MKDIFYHEQFDDSPPDEPSRLEQSNILDPLTFEDWEIKPFVRGHYCAICKGHLNFKPAPGRKWHALCPEHGLIYEHNHISKKDKQQADASERAGMREIKPRPAPKTESEILKSLGY